MTHQYIRSTNQIFTNKKAPNRLRKNHKCINQVVTQQLQGIKDTYKIEIGSATKLDATNSKGTNNTRIRKRKKLRSGLIPIAPSIIESE